MEIILLYDASPFEFVFPFIWMLDQMVIFQKPGSNVCFTHLLFRVNNKNVLPMVSVALNWIEC